MYSFYCMSLLCIYLYLQLSTQIIFEQYCLKISFSSFISKGFVIYFSSVQSISSKPQNHIILKHFKNRIFPCVAKFVAHTPGINHLTVVANSHMIIVGIYFCRKPCARNFFLKRRTSTKTFKNFSLCNENMC